MSDTVALLPSKCGHTVRGDRIFTAAQLQEILSLSENTIYYELQYGSLKSIAFRIGRQWRVSEAALERLMAGGV